MIEIISFFINFTRDLLGNFQYKSYSKLQHCKFVHVKTLEQYIEVFVDHAKDYAFRNVQHVKNVKFEVLQYDESYYIHAFIFLIYTLLNKHGVVKINPEESFRNSIILTVFNDHGLPMYSGILNIKNITQVCLNDYIKQKNKKWNSIQNAY
jgi:hypothetical protein